MASTYPAIFQEFQQALGAHDPKTVATYLTTMRDFVTWLAAQPGGTPFHLGLMTETAVLGYMDSLQHASRAPRTRSKALSGLHRFYQWAMDEGYLRRNPARLMERPTVVTMAPTELSEKRRAPRRQIPFSPYVPPIRSHLISALFLSAHAQGQSSFSGPGRLYY
jgi:site-specific recombinase XerD